MSVGYGRERGGVYSTDAGGGTHGDDDAGRDCSERQTLHARVEDIKRKKGVAPWVEKVVVNEQMSGTLICQPPGHDTDRHYHLVDEWWVVLEGEIDWEIEGRAEIVHARAGDIVFAPARCTITTSGRPAIVPRSVWPSRRPASSTATTARRARGPTVAESAV